MKEEYILYLDESEFSRSKDFIIAGIALSKTHEPLLQEETAAIKRLIWSDEYISQHTPVLHCTEFEKVYSARNIRHLGNTHILRDEYIDLLAKSTDEIETIYHQVYGRLAHILKKSNATVFCCAIKLKEIQELFQLSENRDGNHLVDDKYNIALQRIIESYTHYLVANDGYGDIAYESRNATGENSQKAPDFKLVTNYHKILANSKGITYTAENVIQSRNRIITTPSKLDNLAGLEIADFVAYNLLKFVNCNVSQQATDFMKLLHKLSYNGGRDIAEFDQRSFWGFKVLPSYTSDIAYQRLASDNQSMHNALHNLKKERNKLKIEINRQAKMIEYLKNQNSHSQK